MHTVTRPALILQHPSAPVKLQDPREQSVCDDASVIRSQSAAILELQQTVRELSRIVPAEPLHVRALRGELPEDTCTACGYPVIDHHGGCALAIKAHKPMQTTYPLGLLYGDPHLEVTRAITVALEDQCGPAIAFIFETLGNDERLCVARQLSRVAVSAHLAEMAK